MTRALFALLALPLALPLAEHAAPAPEPFHCQVPCGIYGDSMRVDMHMEDTATIEKAMAQIAQLEADATDGNVDSNQIVRWVMTKDQHAQAIQERVASYWLAQRVKAPADASDEAARAKYVAQLEHMHRVTVAAMKCKQTTDPAHVKTLRDEMLAFSGTYFGEEDLEHIREHHGR